MLGRSLGKQLDAADVARRKTVLVPVPTSFWRRMERGIDHPLAIARGVARETGLPIVRALERRHRPTQQSLPASQRAANIAGAIRLKRWARLEGLTIVLVDDVTTTGATLAAATRAVSGRGRMKTEVRVWAAVLAATAEPGQRR
jgi:predicted amidophosphoribosyltransferase